jgi:zinc protease
MYFDSIPSQAPPPPVDSAQPPQQKERRLDIDDPLARLPRIDIGYRIPSSLSSDDDTIDVLTEILAGGRSSRFYEQIVREKQLAVSVQAFTPNSRGPRLFGIEATPASNVSLDQLEQAIYAEIERLKAGPIADVEIERVRNASRRRFTNTVSTSLSLAAIWRSLRCITATLAASTRAGINWRNSMRPTYSAWPKRISRLRIGPW